jgi:segregation and condensation protein A
MTQPPTDPNAAPPEEESAAEASAAPEKGEAEDFDAPVRVDPSESEHEDSLVVDISGYEGPLDVLLTLARNQKVDLTKISILELAEQYLQFIQEARRLELDLAADYLVMAAWLAFLKSKLLLPPPEDEEGELSGAEMAARLAFQLQRLEAMRKASEQLTSRTRMGIHVFARGKPEGVRVIRTPEWQADLYELLKAYSVQRVRGTFTEHYEVKKLPILAIEDARRRLENLIGAAMDWGRIDSFFPPDFGSGKKRRSALASTLSATLEMVKDGKLEIRQTGPFQPVYVRRRGDEAGGPSGAAPGTNE